MRSNKKIGSSEYIVYYEKKSFSSKASDKLLKNHKIGSNIINILNDIGNTLYIDAAQLSSWKNFITVNEVKRINEVKGYLQKCGVKVKNIDFDNWQLVGMYKVDVSTNLGFKLTRDAAEFLLDSVFTQLFSNSNAHSFFKVGNEVRSNISSLEMIGDNFVRIIDDIVKIIPTGDPKTQNRFEVRGGVREKYIPDENTPLPEKGITPVDCDLVVEIYINAKIPRTKNVIKYYYYGKYVSFYETESPLFSPLDYPENFQ